MDKIQKHYVTAIAIDYITAGLIYLAFVEQYQWSGGILGTFIVAWATWAIVVSICVHVGYSVFFKENSKCIEADMKLKEAMHKILTTHFIRPPAWNKINMVITFAFFVLIINTGLIFIGWYYLFANFISKRSMEKLDEMLIVKTAYEEFKAEKYGE